MLHTLAINLWTNLNICMIFMIKYMYTFKGRLHVCWHLYYTDQNTFFRIYFIAVQLYIKYIILNQWTIFSNDRFIDVTRTGNKDIQCIHVFIFILHIPLLHFRTGFEIVKCAISLALDTIIRIRYPQQCRILRYFDLRNFWYCCCWNIHLKK